MTALSDRIAPDLPRVARACEATLSAIRCTTDGDSATVAGGALRELMDSLRPLQAASPTEMVAEFHHGLGQAFGDGGSSNELRADLAREETRELCDELDADNRVGIAQELADVVYVAYGTAYSLGIDLDAVLAEVHRANMSKRGPDGEFVMREDGKVLKGPHYRRPDIAAVLAR